MNTIFFVLTILTYSFHYLTESDPQPIVIEPEEAEKAEMVGTIAIGASAAFVVIIFITDLPTYFQFVLNIREAFRTIIHMKYAPSTE